MTGHAPSVSPLMLRLRPTDRARRLMEPVQDSLDRALRLLPGGPPMPVSLADLPSPYELRGDELLLSTSLLGPQAYAHDEPEGPVRLDRWRRALASVLEAASLRELSRRVGLPPDPSDWRWIGAAIYAADTVVPDAGLARPDIAAGLASGDLVATPRGGVLPYLAWRKTTDPVQQAQYLLEGGVVSPREWLNLGRWVFDAAGPSQRLPSPVAPPRAHDLPLTLSPWSWRDLHVPAHDRGGHIEAHGPGAADRSWALAGEPHRTLAGATEAPCTLTGRPGAPLGSWEVASAEGFGQIMGARGIQFDVHSDGRLELVLADAAVGPLAALAMAEEVGESGVSEARWSVAGPRRLHFHDVRSESLTLHGRRGQSFAVPSGGFGIGAWLSALEEGPWAWKEMPGRLVLRGEMLGSTIEVRLRPAS